MIRPDTITTVFVSLSGSCAAFGRSFDMPVFGVSGKGMSMPAGVLWLVAMVARALKTLGTPLLLLSLMLRAAEARAQEVPVENAYPTADQIALGRMEFFERRLSTTGEKSCADCHQPERAFTDSGPVSRGVNNRDGTRRAQTILNAVYKRALFHDGRAEFLEGQVTQPLQAAAEMGQQTLGQAFGRLAQIKGYQDAFQAAYGQSVNVQDGIKALAAFERTIVSSDAPIDRYARGETWVFDKDEERGRMLFFTQGCINCHTGRNFTDGDFHNVLGATRDRNGNFDRGRGVRTQNRTDNFKFVTPTLRDIARRAPYFHAGQAADLAAVVELKCNPPQGSELPRLQWTDYDKSCEVKFLSMAFESEHFPMVTQPSLPVGGAQQQATANQLASNNIGRVRRGRR